MSETQAADDLGGRATPSPKASLWLRELPYLAVLVLVLIGVAYTNVSRRHLVGYWEFMALVIGVTVVSTAWAEMPDGKARLRLILTQALHWAAFLIAMNMVLLPGVQRLFNPEATGLSVLMLLALGTVTAGVNILSWQICFIGVVLALSVPAFAWLQQSAIVVVLGLVVAFVGLGVVYSWHQNAKRGSTSPADAKVAKQD
jgi:hypothetical protein